MMLLLGVVFLPGDGIGRCASVMGQNLEPLGGKFRSRGISRAGPTGQCQSRDGQFLRTEETTFPSKILLEFARSMKNMFMR